jgi:hypothetical protein
MSPTVNDNAASREDRRRAEKRHRREKRQVLKRAGSFECSICYSKVPKERRVALPNCTHSFCLNCIGEWTAANSTEGSDTTCPYCRAVFSTSKCWDAAVETIPTLVMSALGCNVGLTPTEVLHQADDHDTALAFPVERAEIHTRFTHGKWRLTKTSQNRDVRRALFRIVEAIDDDFDSETNFLACQWYQYLQAVVSPITTSAATKVIFTHIIEYILADIGLCTIHHNSELEQDEKDDMLLNLDSNIDLSIEALRQNGIVHVHTNKSVGSLSVIWKE